MICWLLTNLYVSWEKREMKTYLLHTVSRKNILKCKILSLHALARLHKRSISTGSLAFSRQKGSVSHFCQCALETWHFIQSLNHQWKCMCVTSKHKQGGLPYTMACKMLPFTETVSWKPLNMIYCMTKPQTTLQRVLKIIRTFHWIISLHATKPETFFFFLSFTMGIPLQKSHLSLQTASPFRDRSESAFWARHGHHVPITTS